MKTVGFCRLEVEVREDSTATLTAYSPTDGTVTIDLTGDELMLFLVEVGNRLADVRAVEKEIQERLALEKEKRRGQ